MFVYHISRNDISESYIINYCVFEYDCYLWVFIYTGYAWAYVCAGTHPGLLIIFKYELSIDCLEDSNV